MQIFRRRKIVAVALQGGGAHGAYSAGVLDRLLENGLSPDRVSGVSSGALLGTMLVQGWVAGGKDGARKAIAQLWGRVAETRAANPMQGAPLEQWLWGPDPADNPRLQGVGAAMRLFAPAQLNPLGHNPLRPVIADLLDPALLAHPDAPRLTVGATDVQTGAAVLFTNREITVDVLLASSCLPFIFPPVEVDGRVLWDGAYSANPPLSPLLSPGLPGELVLICAQPRFRKSVPLDPGEILNRANEMAFQNVLEAELAALPPSVHVTVHEADAALGSLPISSRFNVDGDFLHALFTAGRQAVPA